MLRYRQANVPLCCLLLVSPSVSANKEHTMTTAVFSLAFLKILLASAPAELFEEHQPVALLASKQ